jgi:hypothetical protein
MFDVAEKGGPPAIGHPHFGRSKGMHARAFTPGGCGPTHDETNETKKK